MGMTCLCRCRFATLPQVQWVNRCTSGQCSRVALMIQGWVGLVAVHRFPSVGVAIIGTVVALASW